MQKTLLLPAPVGITLLLASVVALLAALAAAPGASAASRDHGASFAVRCDFSHQLPDDPIVHPDEPGAAHSHDFLGNRSTDAFSTYESMTAPGVTTTCSRPEDTAGYWIPTVSWKDKQGTHELTPTRAVFYYRAGDKAHTTVEPFAKDLRIIADKGVNGARIRWYCGVGDDKAGSPDPPTRCSSGVLGLKIVFPDCVAKDASGAQKIDSDNHRSHMVRSKAQSDGTRACSSTHIPVPTLTINANFPMPTTSGQVTLSSDHQGDLPGSSMHTDFWNTWDQTELETLVRECINGVPPTDPRPDECRAPTATA
jgi:hypothetical protein